jgi:hypothetical protein
MATNLYGPAVNIFDPMFGPTTSDAQTAQQMALVILGTRTNTIDSFPDAGLAFDEQVNHAIDSTSIAMVPQDVQRGILSEPAFVDATVDIASATETGGGGISLALDIEIKGANGDTVGFTVASEA